MSTGSTGGTGSTTGLNKGLTSAAQPLAGLRQQARTRWNALAPRERLYVGVAATLVVLYLVWSVLVAPAWHTLRVAPAAIDKLDLELQQMQRLAAESRSLRAAPPVSPGQALNALKAATDRLGGAARYVMTGDRATVTLTGVSTEALANWLVEVRTVARGRVVEAQLTRGQNGFSGTLVVALGSTS